jgi:hypothetical protein
MAAAKAKAQPQRKCDICAREAQALLCDVCLEAVRRVFTVVNANNISTRLQEEVSYGRQSQAARNYR